MTTIPEPPRPPPCRTYRDSFWGGSIETEESKRLTREWNDYIANYRNKISQYGYIITNPYMR